MAPTLSNRRGTRIARRRQSVLAVAAGGLVGSGARAAVSLGLGVAADGFPFATLAVNLSGSLLLGVYLVRREQAVTRTWSAQFWAIGLFGSFTTFSAFSLDVVNLAANGRLSTAAIYALASVLGGLFAALIGRQLAMGLR